MGLVSSDPQSDRTLLFCDSCDAVLLPPDRNTPRSFRVSESDELTPLFRLEDQVIALAQAEGWAESADGTWSCGQCQSPMASVDRITPDTRLTGLNLLVVEDHADTREMLCAHLTDSGAICARAASGNEAFRTFARQRPGILLSDVWMPDGDGFALIRRIRALSPEEGGLTPAIAISAEANAEQLLMEGYHVMVPKPVDLDEMVNILEEFLRAAADFPSRRTSWTVSSLGPEAVVLALTGYVRPADMRAASAVLTRYLEGQSCEVVVDLRRLTGFSLAVASVAEQALWAQRHAIRHVRILGGSVWARAVVTSTCRLMGLGCSVEGPTSVWPVDRAG
jgi:CheY-like chemotaxis protein